MVPIPGDSGKGIGPIWMSATEVTFDAYDVWVYDLDGERGLPALPADAVSRPSKPYLPPDRGFGHDGYAAICLSYRAAEEFCVWLSARTGKKFRLPTEDEWEHAARAGGAGGVGAGGAYHFGDDAGALDEYAWYAGNASDTTHPVGTKKPNAWGLFDIHGNVQEWVKGRDGKPVTKGGSFRDDPEDLTISARAPQTPDWNSSDPQIPKSKWWLSDGSYVGFRIVCEP